MTTKILNKSKIILGSFRFFAAVVLLLSSVPSVQAQEGSSFGLGILVGQPSGLVAKLWQGKTEALDFGLAYSFEGYFQVYGDYLYHFPDALAKTHIQNLTPYVGVGGSFSAATTVAVGIRIPVGVEWMPVNPSIGVFLELAPGIHVIPSTSGRIQGGVGVRYYF